VKIQKKAGFKPGQIAPKSGEWQIVGPRGGVGAERTLTKGATFPATPKRASTYRLARAAKNGAGR